MRCLRLKPDVFVNRSEVDFKIEFPKADYLVRIFEGIAVPKVTAIEPRIQLGLMFDLRNNQIGKFVSP